MKLPAALCLTLSLLGLPNLGRSETAPLNHAAYTEALKDFRSGKKSSLECLKDSAAAAELHRAAVDDVRERLVDAPDSPLADDVARLISKMDLTTGKLLLSALAEAKATRTTPALTALASDSKSPLAHEAALTLAEVGGAKAVSILAQQVKSDEDLENIVIALSKVSGPGVTDAFIAQIKDTSLANLGRIALIKAAVMRNNQKVTATLCGLISEDSLRLEAQKGILKLGQPGDLPAIREAIAHCNNASTKAALQRFADKLDKATPAEAGSKK